MNLSFNLTSYLSDHPFGTTSYSAGPAHGVFVIRSRTVSKIIAFGSETEQIVEDEIICGPDLSPLRERFRITSGGASTKVDASFSPGEVNYLIETDGTLSRERIPLSEPLSADLTTALALSKEGGVFRVFNPITLSAEKSEAVFRGEEEIDGVLCRRFEVASDSGDSVMFVAPDGTLVRCELSCGIVSSAASDSTEPAPVDLIDATGIPVANPIPPGSVRASLEINGERVDIDTTLFDRSPEEDGLRQTSYIRVDDDIRAFAEDCVGEDDEETCRNLRRKIYYHMTYDSRMGIIRAASDILRSGEGVCRDYAVLLCAAAIAANIPARVVSGLLCDRGGFVFHAWNECFCKGRWLPLDASRYEEDADAAHVPLARGREETLTNINRFIGKINIKVLDFS